MNDTSRPRSKRRTVVIAAIAAVVVVAIAFAGFAWWFLRDDAPDRVSIGDAAAQVTTDDDAGTDTGTDATPPPPASDTEPGADGGDADGITGSWSVDTTIGEFSFEDSTGTFVGFRVAEELSGIGSTEAVGRTPAVTGTLVAEGTTISEVTIEADLTAITTNDNRRDDRVQSALDTAQFPIATFVLTVPIELDDTALTGAAVTADATGELTIHGVTRTVTIPLEAQLVDATIVVVGSLDIVFADFGVEVPDAPIVVSAADHGPLELQLFFTR